MKKTIGLLSIIMFTMILAFTACKKDKEKSLTDDTTYEINLKSFEPEVTILGGGEAGKYAKVIVEKLVKNPDCKYEIVSGFVEFYLEEEMVFAVHFGSGLCDGLATITWIKEDGTTHRKEVDVWKLFKKKEGDNHSFRDKCFRLVLPVDYLMPDGSLFTVAQKEDWTVLRVWHQENPGYEEKPIMQFPVEILFRGGEYVTVNDEREMFYYKKGCDDESNKPKLTKVISEELVRSEECEGEIVSGLIEFYNERREWVYSIEFGDGICDGLATKCWNNTNQERECKEVDVSHWMP